MCILFGLTPRAGRRNHVYLVPDDSKAARRKIEGLALRVSKAVEDLLDSPGIGQDFIVAWQEVTQTTTGRRGREWICLAGIDISKLSDHNRKKCADWLKSRLEGLDEIVASRDWNRSDDLFEVLKEMRAWQKEVGSAWQKYSVIEPNRSGPPRRGWLLAVLLFGLVAVAILAFYQLKKKWRSLCDAILFPFPASRGSTTLTDREWMDYSQRLFEPSGPSGNVISVKERLANELGKLYEGGFRGTPEQRIEQILQRFERDMGRPGNEPLTQLVSSRPPDELIRLFPNGKFDPMGLLELSEAEKRFWHNFKPSQADALIQALIEAGKRSRGWVIDGKTKEWVEENAKRLLTWKTVPSSFPVFEQLSRFHQSGGPKSFRLRANEQEPIRAYYLKEDETTLAKLRNMLTDLVHALTKGADTRQTAWECLKTVIEAVNNDQDRWPQDLSALTDQGKCIADCFEGLRQLCEKWDKLIGTRAQPGDHQDDSLVPGSKG